MNDSNDTNNDDSSQLEPNLPLTVGFICCYPPKFYYRTTSAPTPTSTDDYNEDF